VNDLLFFVYSDIIYLYFIKVSLYSGKIVSNVKKTRTNVDEKCESLASKPKDYSISYGLEPGGQRSTLLVNILVFFFTLLAALQEYKETLMKYR